jgi:hypothetical protein
MNIDERIKVLYSTQIIIDEYEGTSMYESLLLQQQNQVKQLIHDVLIEVMPESTGTYDDWDHDSFVAGQAECVRNFKTKTLQLGIEL